jgi:hypothetical protein
MGYDLVIGGIRTHLRAKIVPLTRIAQARSDRSPRAAAQNESSLSVTRVSE